MLVLNDFKIEGKISLKALKNLKERMKEREQDLSVEMYKMRGKFPKPDNYAVLRAEMNNVKETISDIDNCFRLYEIWGNIAGKSVLNDCDYKTVEERAYQKALNDISHDSTRSI